MPLLPTLLRTLAPSFALAYGIQTAVAIPSIAAQTERFYDLSGSLTYLGVVGGSFFLPFFRAGEGGGLRGSGGSGLRGSGVGVGLGGLGGLAGGGGLWWWRQAVLSAAVGVWAVRLGSYLFTRITHDAGQDSRFDTIRHSPLKFSAAFFAQATWVSLCSLPVLLINSLPRSAFCGPAALRTAPYLTDVLGLTLFALGLGFEITADRQKAAWVEGKKEKKHAEEFLTSGLWARSRHPNYFGEATLWSGIAVVAAGVLVRRPALVALGLSGGAGGLGGVMGRVLVGGLCAVSPAFVTFLLLRVSGVPLSEGKYDAKFGHREDYRRWKRETPVFVPKF